jgi:outer membrane lipoprotein-sorting protein
MMSLMTRLPLLATAMVLAGLLAGDPGSAEDEPLLANLSRDDAAAVRRVEDYLNGIETMVSDFVQVSSNGAFAEGQVYLDRPGRLRFEYAPPNPTRLIAAGQPRHY